MTDLMLPWPPKVLSPNARTHWATKSRAAKSYRNTCYLLCLQAALPVPKGRALLSLEFIPPDRRRRDDDNCIAAFKSGRDGVAQRSASMTAGLSPSCRSVPKPSRAALCACAFLIT